MGENGRLEEELSPLVLMSMFNRVVDRVQDRVAVRNTKYKYLYLYLYLYLYRSLLILVLQKWPQIAVSGNN